MKRKKFKNNEIILVIFAVLFIFIQYFLKPKEFKIKTKYYSEMILAKDRTELIQNEIKLEKLRRGIKIDENIDKNKTGLIGEEWTEISTTLGSLESKRISTNPDFSALFVKILKENGLKKGDIVAANFSSSFPALNLAFIIAADILELNTVIITSTGSSTYGGNIEEFDYLDMENYLYSNGFIKNRSIAWSLGGAGDVGKDFTDITIERLKRKNTNYNLDFFYNENLEKNIQERYEYYLKKSRNKIKAFINIGGNIVSLGNSMSILNNYKIKLENDNIHSGLVGKFLEDKIPVFYLLNLKNISLYYGISYDMDNFSKTKFSKIYYEESKNIFNYLIIFLFFIFLFIIRKNKFKKLN